MPPDLYDSMFYSVLFCSICLCLDVCFCSLTSSGTVLHAVASSARRDSPDAIDVLVAAGGSVRQAAADGGLPHHAAAVTGNILCLARLLENAAGGGSKAKRAKRVAAARVLSMRLMHLARARFTRPRCASTWRW